MTTPSQIDLFNAVDATWAPYAFHTHENWLVREGAGGGQRVSATTLLSEIHDYQISIAVEKMASLGQTPLFMIRNTDEKLDAELHGLNYDIVDPVVILIAETQKLLRNPTNQMQAVQTLGAPNANVKSIWADGGINQGRLNVMARVEAPKTIINAGQMGVAFAAAFNSIAMVHAVEVASAHRRKGVANALMYKAFQWAEEQNCKWVSVLTVRENIPARTLYENLGMVESAAYHYRRASQF